MVALLSSTRDAAQRVRQRFRSLQSPMTVVHKSTLGPKLHRMATWWWAPHAVVRSESAEGLRMVRILRLMRVFRLVRLLHLFGADSPTPGSSVTLNRLQHLALALWWWNSEKKLGNSFAYPKLSLRRGQN
eukprot:844569-Amphidinium_carterae.1